jgi:hypothetical protein
MYRTRSRWFVMMAMTVLMVLVLAACGGSDQSAPTAAPTSEPTAQPTATAENTATPTAVAPTATPSPEPTPEPTSTPAPEAEDNASGAIVTIADWPAPPEALDVEISGDTLSFHTPLTLADVAEFYRPVYDSLDLDASCLEDVADYTSVSCSTSTGDVSINFFAYTGFDDTEVEIEYINYALAPAEDTGELGVVDEEGLPVADDHTGYTSDGSEFMRTVAYFSPSSLETLVELTQTELAARGWTEDDSNQTEDSATLTFSGPDGQLNVTLQAGDETEVVMTRRNRAAAEEAGILPPAGQARLYLVNFSTDELTVDIDGQTIQVPPEAGMESPDDAPTLDLAPGTYDVTTTVGGSSVTDEITIGADESWALLLDEMGALPLQMY